MNWLFSQIQNVYQKFQHYIYGTKNDIGEFRQIVPIKSLSENGLNYHDDWKTALESVPEEFKTKLIIPFNPQMNSYDISQARYVYSKNVCIFPFKMILSISIG